MHFLPKYRYLSLYAIFMAMLFSFALAGCGSKDPSSEPARPTVDSSTTSIAIVASTPTPSAPAAGNMGKVTITWGTESEQECYGFNVFRSRSADGPFEKANKKLVRGAGTTHVPQRYQVVDQPLPMGETFYYKVQQIDLSGEKRDITPVMPCKVTQPADAAEGAAENGSKS